MSISRTEIFAQIKDWIKAWNEHDLDGVMKLLHEDIVFENWAGTKINGKNSLKRAWAPWFQNHGNFNFVEEDLFFDEIEQKMLFKWRLEWPSQLIEYKGKHEIRQGVDVLHFRDGMLIHKLTYSKTTVQIEGLSVPLKI